MSQKKINLKKKLVLFWTWICRGSKLEDFQKQEGFYWDPKTRKKVKCQVTAQNLRDFKRTKLFMQYQTHNHHRLKQSNRFI